MTITETCACGAVFAASDRWASDARKAAAEWREGHKHAEAVGICGDRPAMPDGFPSSLPSPYCALKAGHAGMHGDGDGAHWGRSGPEPATRAPQGVAPVSVDPGDELGPQIGAQEVCGRCFMEKSTAGTCGCEGDE
jgi:hypothetical protein